MGERPHELSIGRVRPIADAATLELQTNHFLLVLLGLGLCLLGFVKRPRSKLDLVRPRFVVPAFIFLTTFGEVIYLWFHPDLVDRHTQWRLHQADRALVYFCLCVVGFWIGFALPLGRVAARKLTPLHDDIHISTGQIHVAAYILAGFAPVMSLLIGGPGFISYQLGSYGGLFAGIGGQWLAVFAQITVILGAFLLGMSWPAPGQRTPGRIALSSFLLVLCLLPLAAKFSRGAGMPLIIACFGYAVRYGRVSFLAFMGATLLSVVFARTGLWGRGIYHHHAGFVPFFTLAAEMFVDSLLDAPRIFFQAAGRFTVLTTTMEGMATTDLRPLSMLDWARLQIPIPRIFGIHPDYTFRVANFVGGARHFGYTSSIYGDTFGHFGFFGACWFIVFGAAYRFVDAIAFRPRVALPDYYNLAIMLVPTSYVAMMLGTHNSFRAWLVPMAYPLYMLLFVILIRRLFVTNSQDYRIPVQYVG